MERKPVLEHPWQNGPTELIGYAIEHLHMNTDFDNRIAFLLLDVGVETLFKTYLTLPEKVTGSKTEFQKRKEASEGTFHKLVEGIVLDASGKLSDIDLTHVEFFHDIRNKLYHKGNGITVPTGEALGYAQIAVDLLRLLLGVDLSEMLEEPELIKKCEEQNQKFKKMHQEVLDAIDKKCRDIDRLFLLIIEKIAPDLVLPSTITRFNEILSKYGSEENFVEPMEFKRWFNVENKYEYEAMREMRELLVKSLETSKYKDILLKKVKTTFGKNPITGEEIKIEIERIVPTANFNFIAYNDVLEDVLRCVQPDIQKRFFDVRLATWVFPFDLIEIDITTSKEDIDLKIKKYKKGVKIVSAKLEKIENDLRAWLEKQGESE